eukprot:TRINITY_DN717_c0_g1_i2.p1 TRINITY_DN717_c0_g1~~TRINITY_DN717_c0_g1_i2.p1  ORF type:complete len:658 (-),score=260.84 TRINITY_DN717_c0_g1_i2:993-2966(-)
MGYLKVFQSKGNSNSNSNSNKETNSKKSQPKRVLPEGVQCIVEALYDFSPTTSLIGAEPDVQFLEFCAGSEIFIIRNENGWCEGILQNKQGVFPSSYVRTIFEEGAIEEQEQEQESQVNVQSIIKEKEQKTKKENVDLYNNIKTTNSNSSKTSNTNVITTTTTTTVNTTNSKIDQSKNKNDSKNDSKSTKNNQKNEKNNKSSNKSSSNQSIESLQNELKLKDNRIKELEKEITRLNNEISTMQPTILNLKETVKQLQSKNNNTTNNTTNNIINQDLVSISELLKFSQYADIEIKLNDKSFLAHTIIINSICNLFFKIHSIVNNSSNSKYTNYIDLNFGFWSSIENNTIIFEKFLNVLYSNIVNITNEIEEEAFNIIANQYDIKDLKNLLNELKNTKQLNTKYPFVISLPIVNLNNLLAQSICNPEFSDITLKINSNLSTFNIPAHKSLLAFRSNYFRTIFESHFKESTQNYIELNTSPAAIIYILRWCYSNLYNQTEQNSSIHVPKDLLVPLETVFFQLLELSNQYNLQGFLNQLCSNIQVTQENIFGLYWFSKTYQINEIEEACCLFLTQFPSNSNQISEIVIKSALSDNKTENDELVIQLIEKAKIAWENANNKDTVERRLRAAQLQQIFEKEKQEAINDSNKEQFKILQKIIRK